MSETPPIVTVVTAPDHGGRSRLPRVWVDVRPSTRVAWAVVAVGMLTVLGIAIWLDPAPAGMGTHEALGLPPCSLVVTSGIPCPTCGMTTAFAYAMRGRFISAVIAQPMGLVLWGLCVALSIYAITVTVRGRALWINWDRIAPRLMLMLGVLLMLSWFFKIAWGVANGDLPVK